MNGNNSNKTYVMENIFLSIWKEITVEHTYI